MKLFKSEDVDFLEKEKKIEEDFDVFCDYLKKLDYQKKKTIMRIFYNKLNKHVIK